MKVISLRHVFQLIALFSLVLPLCTIVNQQTHVVYAASKQVHTSHTASRAMLATTTDPILFIHGIDSNSARDCSHDWSATTSFLRTSHTINGTSVKWSGPMVKLAYYFEDFHCGDDNNSTTPYKLYSLRNKCTGYNDKAVGTNNETIEHLGCELAWYIYTYYTNASPTPQNVEIVGYSMGGLIARWAMAQSHPNNPPFPPAKLLVRDAVEMDSPNGGFSIVNFAACGTDIFHLCVEGKEMTPSSPFMNKLAQQAQNPQGAAGTQWTLMGSDCGLTCAYQSRSSSSQGLCLDISPKSAVKMNGAYKIVYQKPCYSHQDVPGFSNSMLVDSSTELNATVLYCNGCSYPGTKSTTSPHAIFAILYALAEAFTSSSTTAQHQTEVEPDTFSFGSTIVSVFQVGRFNQGSGSDNLGWATSTDSGKTWTHGFLSGITTIAGGTYERVSDPAVAYDAQHKVWMIVSVAFDLSSPGTNAILVSRSTNGGLTWSNPVPVRVANAPSILDKSWIVCDTTASSPFYGHCYVQWDDHHLGNLIFLSTSTNGGTTWGSPKTTADQAHGIGGQPLVSPNGTVIVPIDNAPETALLAFTSTNGGSSWSNAVTLTSIQFHQPAGGLRADPLISADMDASGTVYIVWSDCRYVANCAANQIVLLTLSPGSSAPSAVKRISLNQPNSSLPDFLIPNIAVDKATSGSTVHLKFTYYYYPNAACDVTTCNLDVGFFSCIGGTCSSQLQLAGPMKLTWLPKTGQIVYPCSPNCWMVGDYISTSIVNGHAFPVFANATAPSGGLFNEAMFVASGLESGTVKLTQLSSDPYQKEG